MNSLKRDLTEYGVEYTEKVFTSADGIAGLGPEPFVSNQIIACMCGCMYMLCICFVYVICMHDCSSALNIMLEYDLHVLYTWIQCRILRLGYMCWPHTLIMYGTSYVR